MFKKFLVLLCFTNFIFAKDVILALSANVSYAIEDLKKEFNTIYPNINVKVIIGGSGALTAQIKNNAPFDVFMSANMKYPQFLYDEKLAITKPLIYAKGSLCLFSNKKQDLSKGLFLLEDKNVQKIAIANPKTAPYGKASVEALKNAKIYKKIQNKFIYGQNISQTLIYSLKVANIGLIAKSSLFSSKMKKFKENINWKEVSQKYYTPIEQGIVMLKNAQKNEDAKKFYDFILSKKSQKILKEYGYLVDE